MVKLIVGLKGSGKTKALIEMVNAKVNETPGSVVCLEKGGKLIHEINYQARLIDTDEYKIGSADALYGFLAGIYASNHDLTDLFIDSALKICNNQIDTFEQFVSSVKAFAEDKSLNVVMTVSCAPEELSDSVRAMI